MFEKLRNLFKKAEEAVSEKLKEKEKVAPPEPALKAEREEKPKPREEKPQRKGERPQRKEEKPKKIMPPRLREEEAREKRGEARPELVEAEPAELAEELRIEAKEEKPREAGEARQRELPKEIKKEVRVSLGTRLKKAIRGVATLGDEEIDDIAWNLQLNLMQNDVAVEVAEKISSELKERLRSHEFRDPKTEVRHIFRDILLDILKVDQLDFIDAIKKGEKPAVIVFFGVNGTGKTTTIAKVAHTLKKHGLSVVLAAGDTFRAGAIEQLEKHGASVGVNVIKHHRGADSAAVVFDTVKHARAKGIDVVLADTSGRMQSNADLMGEMEKIVRVNKPTLRIFIGDALTGNDAVDQARQFNDHIGIDASILAKCDASKGGSALSISYVTKKPIVFLGVGQSYDDLVPFVPKQFVDELT